ncbi:MAG: hypothetical protein AB4050_17995 [Synechococcus sp.]
MRYGYRGIWKDIYINDNGSSIQKVNLGPGDAESERMPEVVDSQYRCLSLPGSKVCIHYRLCDSKEIVHMACPDGVPIRLWRCLQRDLLANSS